MGEKLNTAENSKERMGSDQRTETHQDRAGEGIGQEYCMVSDAVRNAVWQNLLDIAKDIRYLDALQNRYRRKYYCVRFLLVVSGVLTALPLVPLDVPYINDAIPFIGLFIIGLVLWDLVFDYGKKFSTLRFTTDEFGKLENQYRELWDKIDGDSMNDNFIHKKMKKLESAALSLFNGIDVPTDKKLNEQCQKYAFKSEKNRYVKQTGTTL